MSAKGRGVVAAGHEETAEAAAIILREGGTAFDAALSAMAVACVTEPVLASLGGGGFLLAVDSSGSATVYDFFAQTPIRRRAGDVDFRAVLADFGTTTQEFHIGFGSIATPGTARGIVEIHRRLGTLPLAVILEPAIRLAREGVTITPFQAYLFSVVAPIYTASSGARACFGGTAHQGTPAAGERLRNPDLADVLEQLARHGDEPFYEGDVAVALAKCCREGGGHLTRRDLASYRVEIRYPLELEHQGTRIHLNPPPSSGGILIAFALRLAALAGLGSRAHGGGEHLSMLARIMEKTNKARVDSGLEAEGATASLLDPALVSRYAAEVTGRPASTRGTTHISVIDAAGNLASASLSNGEGCGYVPPGTGIMPNNMLGEEDLSPLGLGRWPTNRRIASMMCPAAIAWPDGPIAALGSGGSNRLRTAIVQVLVNLLDFGMSIGSAVESPRIHLERGRLDIEPGFDTAALERVLQLAESHQQWSAPNMFFGGVHAALLDPKDHRLVGAGDLRRGGAQILV
ncbi:MAG: gamma-glutamyltransferase family protein [Alphaproteobacteria bacterium]